MDRCRAFLGGTGFIEGGRGGEDEDWVATRHSATGFPSESARGGCRLGRCGDQLKLGSVNALGLAVAGDATWVQPRAGGGSGSGSC